MVLDRLIGRRLTNVMFAHGSVQLRFEDDYALIIFNPILITSPAGDIDCFHPGFRDVLGELVTRLVNNVEWRQGRFALIFADAVVSVGLTQKDGSGVAMFLMSGLPGSPGLFVPIKDTRFDSYPLDC